jgi:acetyl-CoA carboxylase beta subunit
MGDIRRLSIIPSIAICVIVRRCSLFQVELQVEFHKCVNCGNRFRISSSQIIHCTTQSKEAVEKLKELKLEGVRLAVECRNSTRRV